MKKLHQNPMKEYKHLTSPMMNNVIDEMKNVVDQNVSSSFSLLTTNKKPGEAIEVFGGSTEKSVREKELSQNQIIKVNVDASML